MTADLLSFQIFFFFFDRKLRELTTPTFSNTDAQMACLLILILNRMPVRLFCYSIQSRLFLHLLLSEGAHDIVITSMFRFDAKVYPHLDRSLALKCYGILTNPSNCTTQSVNEAPHGSTSSLHCLYSSQIVLSVLRVQGSEGRTRPTRPGAARGPRTRGGNR